MSTTVSAAIAPVALIFKLNNGLVTRALDGLSDDDVWKRPGGGNPIAWLVGHMAYSRSQLLALLGTRWETSLGPLFKRGVVLGTSASYPSRQSIEDAWRESHHQMRDAFALLTPERMIAPATGKELPGAKTLGDQLAFMAFHESYHVGQLGYIRRQIGASALAD